MLRDLGKDRDPSEDMDQLGRSKCLTGKVRISRAPAVSATLTSSDGASVTVMPPESLKGD